MSEKDQKLISIVIPVKNEEENIKSLFMEILEAMKKFLAWECIWIDDGSTDGTVAELANLAKEYKQIKVFEHISCFGQSAAMAVGFRMAKGDIIVTLDGDGQNDPASIPTLIETLLLKDADMINGIRGKRHDSTIRKLSSKIANAFRNLLTGEHVKDVGCSLRAFRKDAVMEIPVFKGMHRFLPTLVRIAGYNKIFEIPVRHRQRSKGKTKYGISNRLWVGIYDVFAVVWMKSRLVFPKLKTK
jgi:glycosyltransferase involved in cell wall biosynthesis